MTPQTKKLLSALLVTVAVALLGVAGQYAAHLPPALQSGAVAIIAGFVHFVNAWGTQAEQTEQVVERVADVIDKEAP